MYHKCIRSISELIKINMKKSLNIKLPKVYVRPSLDLSVKLVQAKCVRQRSKLR